MTEPRRPVVALVAREIHDRGGMERAFSELILHAHGRYDFVVVSAVLDERLRELVRWRRIRLPRRPASIMLPLFFVLAGMRLGRVRADLVHTLGAVAATRADVATVQYCHAGHLERTGSLVADGLGFLRRVNSTLSRVFALAAERRCYRPTRVAVLAAVSSGVAAELRRHYPSLPVALTPNGVDGERFRPDAATRASVRAEHAIADDEVVALFVGGDWERKGLAVAIEALALARRAGTRPLRLWVVGRGQVDRFAALATRLGVPDAVDFLGEQTNTERYFRGADLFVLPTLYETFSLAAHEAASAGLPIVSTAVHGVDELVGDCEAGFLVGRSAEEFAKAIVLLADDAALRARLGAAGHAHTSALNWESAAESVVALYSDRLSSRPAEDAHER